MTGAGTGKGEPGIPRLAVLAIDTATSTAMVALGTTDGELRARRMWRAGYRHGEELLSQIDSMLRDEGQPLDGIGAIVVGTGPGAFTGLRVGLATAKGLAHALGCPIAAVSTGAALRAAADGHRRGGGTPAPARIADPLDDPVDRASNAGIVLLLPAGPSDRVVVDGHGARLLPGGTEPSLDAGTTLVAIDLDGRAPPDSVARGHVALEGLASWLLWLGAERLGAGGDDLAAIVPDYVTLPRGIREESGEVTWSHDLR